MSPKPAINRRFIGIIVATCHTVTLQPSGHQFQVEEGEAVLAAALRQGFVLPYGCKNGACGSCKGKILSGSVDYGVYQPKALTDEEKAQGKALFCQAKPLSDLVLEARTIGAAKDIQVKKLPCRVQKLERLSDDVMVLQLKLPANEKLVFLAGQYIEFLLKDGSRRSFSIANPPHDAELIELHVRHVAGGQFTDHVFGKMKERDILRCEGPLGTFFLREESDKPIVFVASGTGFAPIKAVIEHMFHKGDRATGDALLGRTAPQGPLHERAGREVGRRASGFQVRAGDLRRAARRQLARPHAASCTAR